MNQHQQYVQGDLAFAEQYDFGQTNGTQFIVILFRFKYYKIYVPHDEITLLDLIFFFQLRLEEKGIVLQLDQIQSFDSQLNIIREDEIVKNINQKTKYIQVFHTGFYENNEQHILNHNEMEIVRKNQQLDDAQSTTLRGIMFNKRPTGDIPYLAFPKRDYLNQFKVFIVGPTNTPYQDGIYELQFTYQNRIFGPQVQFITPIFHPNIYNGQISIEGILDNQNPDKTIIYLLYLLKYPLLIQALDKSCAMLYQENRDEYFQKAKSLNEKYAKPSIDEIVRTITSQHVSIEKYKQIEQSIIKLLKFRIDFFQSKSWYDFEYDTKNELEQKYNSRVFYPKVFNKQKKQSLNQVNNIRMKFDPPNFKISSSQLLNNLLQKSSTDTMFLLRLKFDINECLILDQKEMFKIFLNENDLRAIKVIFLGPKNTPFDGGIYQLNLKIAEQFPFRPPKCTLQTRIYHPNIYGENISLDRLKENWTPQMNIRTLILSIISFLDDPNPNDPLDIECAALYNSNRGAYNQIVQQYKNQYASPSVDQMIKDIFAELPDQPQYDYLNRLLTEWIEYWKKFGG